MKNMSVITIVINYKRIENICITLKYLRNNFAKSEAITDISLCKQAPNTLLLINI